MLQMVTKQIATARKVAIGRKKKKRKLSYRKHSYFNAFTYNQTGFKFKTETENGRRKSFLYLSKIGSIRIVLHRQPVNVKQVTIFRTKTGKWYAVVACNILRRTFSMIRYIKSVGIDVGITKFCHDSDNHVEDNPQFLTKMLKPVRRAHRRLSRRQVGSNNHRKAKHMLARLYERITNRRKDFLHKLSNYYSNKYDLIFLERLRVNNLTKNHRLARKILDASWSTFKNMLQYKANRVIEVESAYTSVDCSRCGNSVSKSLAVRIHVCPKCGVVLDRDYNASLNILHRGLKSLMLPSLLLLPVERREVTPVEIVQQGQPRSMKQEEKEAHVLRRG